MHFTTADGQFKILNESYNNLEGKKNKNVLKNHSIGKRTKRISCLRSVDEKKSEEKISKNADTWQKHIYVSETSYLAIFFQNIMVMFLMFSEYHGNVSKKHGNVSYCS